MSIRPAAWQREALKTWASQPWRSKTRKGVKSKSILLRVTPELHIELKELSLIHGITLQEFIEQCCLEKISAIVKRVKKG